VWVLAGKGMEFCVPEVFIESKANVSFLVIKAYTISLFFLVVVLFLAVGDVWTQFSDIEAANLTSNYTYFHQLVDFSRLTL
jgi:hypothetical protein